MGKSQIGTTAKNSNCVRQHRKMTPGEWICCVTSLSMGKKRRWRRVSRRHVVGTSVRLTKYHTTIEAENKSPEIERRCASALWSLRPPTRFTTPRKSRKKAESIDRVRQIKKKPAEQSERRWILKEGDRGDSRLSKEIFLRNASSGDVPTCVFRTQSRDR